MANLVKAFADIGEVFLQDEKRLRNTIYQYNDVKAFFCDIETKKIEPWKNIDKETFIVCRGGSTGSAPFLYPVTYYSDSAGVVKDSVSVVKDIMKGLKRCLAFFKKDEIITNPILTKLSTIDESFFDSIKDQIDGLQVDKKEVSFFALSYQDKPISAYFTKIFDDFLEGEGEQKEIYGYDMITNKQGVGGDAKLPFCSVNELPSTLQNSEKNRVFPLSQDSAKKISLGWKAIETKLSANFYGMKLAILPTLLDKSLDLRDVIDILEDGAKGKIHDIEFAEEVVLDLFLQSTAKAEAKMPILNTILFYKVSSAAKIVKMTIDDVLPSYISHLSHLLIDSHIKTFFTKLEKKKKGKDQESEESKVLFLQSLFPDRLELMHFLLSRTKYKTSTMIEKFADLITQRDTFKKEPFEWTKYFYGFYSERTPMVLERFADFFNELDLLNDKILIKRRKTLVKFEKDQIKDMVKSHEFLSGNATLESAYLLGMLSAAVVNWQYGAFKKSSFGKWLDRAGTINRDKLSYITRKADEAIRKTKAAKGTNTNIKNIRSCLLDALELSLTSKKVETSANITIAFALGGNDFAKINKTIKDNEGEQDA